MRRGNRRGGSFAVQARVYGHRPAGNGNALHEHPSRCGFKGALHVARAGTLARQFTHPVPRRDHDWDLRRGFAPALLTALATSLAAALVALARPLARPPARPPSAPCLRPCSSSDTFRTLPLSLHHVPSEPRV